MTTKKQKRLAGEARAREADAAQQARIEQRKRVAELRARRRAEREAAEARREQNIKATKLLRSGSQQ